mmetsp:Transcript_26981/g.31389  ORF Transcript_26981/g.31389 Transcript_26981/m.31389 type:complete len:344 (-) Transcript_26981:243-1274(-)
MSDEGILPQLLGQQRLFHEDVELTRCSRALHDSAPHNDVWRKMVVDWCYTVVDHIQVDREVVYVAISILDRFLAHQASSTCPSKRSYLSDRKSYESAVMTSLLITLKLQGITSLCVQDFVKMSRNSVSSSDIVAAGKDIVQSLSWNKEIPTASSFAHAYVEMLPSSVSNETKQSLFEYCVYSIELSVRDQFFSKYLPSLLAWMVFENAMDTVEISRDICQETKSNISEMTGHEFNSSLCQQLKNMVDQTIEVQENDRNEERVAVIPTDDEEDNCAEVQSSQRSRNILHSRPMPISTSVNVVSMEHLDQMNKDPTRSITTNKRHADDTCEVKSTMSRSKRMRVF